MTKDITILIIAITTMILIADVITMEILESRIELLGDF